VGGCVRERGKEGELEGRRERGSEGGGRYGEREREGRCGVVVERGVTDEADVALLHLCSNTTISVSSCYYICPQATTYSPMCPYTWILLVVESVVDERAYVSIRQHTSAYVSIRQHTSAYVHLVVVESVVDEPVVVCSSPHLQHTPAYASIRQHTSAYVSIRQHTRRASCRMLFAAPAAYASIRQHTPAYVSIRQHTSAYATSQLSYALRPTCSIRQHTSAYTSASCSTC
jgi:hypothetical protein